MMLRYRFIFLRAKNPQFMVVTPVNALRLLKRARAAALLASSRDHVS